MSQVLPGGTVGVIGGGQLGRMLALEARRMGYRVGVLDPVEGCPAAQVSDFHICAALGDVEAAAELAARSDVVTIETEHIPPESLERVAESRPMHPSASLLRTIQDRQAQKTFLDAQQLPQARWAPVGDAAELVEAARVVGLPAILKSRRAGYDGKGQARVETASGLTAAWERIGKVPAVLEAFVPFRAEVSVLLARSTTGEVRSYPLAENAHRHHVLHTTRMPAREPAELGARAEAIAIRVVEALDHRGMMAVEMFVLEDGSLLVNEVAPRTHNSGHVTFGASATSQFEQHLRAVCGLPLGDPTPLRPAVMFNLLGDSWVHGEPDWAALLAYPEARLHLYGKDAPAPGRKMGHVILLDGDTDRALQTADVILAQLSRRPV